jgi:hypothetical protein
MNLNATIRSEYASKEQGGDTHLEIIVRDKKSRIIAYLSFYPGNKVAHRITLVDSVQYDIDTIRSIEYQYPTL